jgi:integrase
MVPLTSIGDEMITLYRRPGSPYYWYDITVERIRERKSTERTLKKEAMNVAEARRRFLLDRAQLGLGVQEISLRDALTRYYLPTKARNRRLKDYETICNKVCGQVEGKSGIGGSVLMSELTNKMITDWRQKREAEGAADQTIDHELKVVSAAYNLVVDNYRVRPGLRFPMKRPKGIARYLFDDEIDALVERLDPGRGIPARKSRKNPSETATLYYLDPTARMYRQRQDNYDLVVMLLYTGCRFGEIARLTWDMVDTIEFRWIRIFRNKVKGSDNDNEMLATTARMRDVLRRRYEARGNGFYVFKGWVAMDDGEDVPRSSTAAIRRALKDIGVNHPSKVARFGRRDVRSLRDTFATRLRMKAGMPLDQIQTLLGHASPVMTQKYAKLTVNKASLDAVGLMEQF